MLRCQLQAVWVNKTDVLWTRSVSQRAAMWEASCVRTSTLSRCVDRVHTRSCSSRFMILSDWGGYTNLSRREVFHLLVWCSTSLNNRRSLCVLHINGEFQQKYQASKSQQFSLLKRRLAQSRLFSSKEIQFIKAWEKCPKSSCLSSCIFKAEHGLRIWTLAAGPSESPQRESRGAVEISPTVRGVWTVQEICFRMSMVISPGSRRYLETLPTVCSVCSCMDACIIPPARSVNSAVAILNFHRLKALFPCQTLCKNTDLKREKHCVNLSSQTGYSTHLQNSPTWVSALPQKSLDGAPFSTSVPTDKNLPSNLIGVRTQPRFSSGVSLFWLLKLARSPLTHPALTPPASDERLPGWQASPWQPPSAGV